MDKDRLPCLEGGKNEILRTSEGKVKSEVKTYEGTNNSSGRRSRNDYWVTILRAFHL